ncbi:expressed unknown protein [Seminavis robusta]|uniref:DUF6604 domain-containing protein n=1 Tax=Seminavis robusta TaxID=568900 RepID=A0A9N8HNJ6_9STRA|nr:expressed unknown protein [Seminavis robusta]|eukprot:Sro1002_g229890.1 n/a (905) ;mRNA; r:26743-29555
MPALKEQQAALHRQEVLSQKSQWLGGVDFRSVHLEEESHPSSSNTQQHQQQQQQQPKGIYAVYKQATLAFRDGLVKLLPKKFRLSSVDDYKKASDWVLEKTAAVADYYEASATRGNNSRNRKSAPKVILIDEAIFRHLDVTIRHRQQQMTKHGDNDKGHQYILYVLSYCREVLEYSHRIAHLVLQSSQKSTSRALCHKTVPSSTSEDAWEIGSKEEEDKEPFSFMPPPPNPPPPCPMDSAGNSEDLIQADDRFQCIAFLETMDRLMGIVRERFDRVKAICILDGIEDANDKKLLHTLMEASIASNTATECIQSTWAELTLEQPHIRNFYDVLAIVFICPLLSAASMQEKHDILSHDSPRYPHALTHFVGDVIEACFTCDGLDTTRALRSFAERVSMPDGGWEKDFFLEEAAALARDISDLIMEPSSHKIRSTFLRGYKYIGRQHCILNTQKVLQASLAFLKHKGDDGPKALAKAGCHTFERSWHEDQRPARGTQCLDRLLVSEILPELVAACQVEDRYRLPVQNNSGVYRLIPLLHSLDRLLKGRLGSAVPIHVAFGFHAMLTSILAMQGNMHLERLGSKGESASLNLFDQLKGASRTMEHCALLALFENILKPRWKPISPTSRRNAYWNPIVAGSFCVYSVYMGMVSGNMFLRIDDVRTVLHCYNALRTCGLVEPIAFLDWIDGIFAETPSVWFAGKNTARGDFAKNFLIGTGLSVRDVSVLVAMVKSENGIRIDKYRFVDDRRKDLTFTRSMGMDLSTTHYSQGCRVLFRKDYAGFDYNEDGSDPASREGRFSPSGAAIGDTTECETVIAKACHAFRCDIDAFGGGFVDLTGAGWVFKDFLKALSSSLEWEDGSDVSNWLHVFGELDFRPSDRLDQSRQVASKMTDYFAKAERNAFALSHGI